LIFFAYEKVLGRHWTRYSVMPSINVREKQLGAPVPGLDGVLAAKVDHGKLQKGDVLFFLQRDDNLDADEPLLVRGDDRYGVWHTGLVHSVRDGKARVIHAKPGAEVLVEALDAISFDGLFDVAVVESVKAKAARATTQVTLRCGPHLGREVRGPRGGPWRASSLPPTVPHGRCDGRGTGPARASTRRGAPP